MRFTDPPKRRLARLGRGSWRDPVEPQDGASPAFSEIYRDL